MHQPICSPSAHSYCSAKDLRRVKWRRSQRRHRCRVCGTLFYFTAVPGGGELLWEQGPRTPQRKPIPLMRIPPKREGGRYNV